MRARILSLLASTALLFVACFNSDNPLSNAVHAKPDAAPVGEVLGTAVPLAYAVTLAMAKAAGENVPCVNVTTGCSGYPCSLSVDITVTTGCPMPIGQSPSGTVHVAGYWTSANDAVLAAYFVGVNPGGSATLVAAGITAVAAHRNGDTITIAYADEHVSVSSPRAVTVTQSGQAGWAVTVKTAGTLGDVTDDTMTISGARTEVSTSNLANVSVVTIVDAKMTPSCHQNPVSGTASYNVINGLQSGTAVLSFHNPCDGDADVTVGTGVYLKAIGDGIPLHMLN